MPTRESRIGVGTIGSLPCEIKLNSILIEQNDHHITHIVLRRYELFRKEIRELRPLLVDPTFYKHILFLVKEKHFFYCHQHADHFPKALYTHWLCCMTAAYRQGIKIADRVIASKRKRIKGIRTTQEELTNLACRSDVANIHFPYHEVLSLLLKLEDTLEENRQLHEAAGNAQFQFVKVPDGYTCSPQAPQVLVNTLEQVRETARNLRDDLVLDSQSSKVRNHVMEILRTVGDKGDLT